MSKIIHAIVHTYIENTICFDIISKDGITTDMFEINKANGLFVKSSINVRQIKSQIPTIIRAVSIAKNLDYYQNKICHEILSISDTERIKVTLQKLRVIILALFLKLNKLLIEIKTHILSEHSHDIEEWNKNSEESLIITSSVLVNYGQRKTNTQNLDTLKRTLEYLDTSNTEIDDQISYLY
jgi:aspartate/tyrosine/aromatic aminotransferase